MKKFYFIIVFILTILNVDAQLLDWKKIISGDISAYKQYNIKSALLIQDGNVINRVEIFSDKNEIVVSNKAGISFLNYDSQNRLKYVQSKDIEFRISYFDNGMIESVEREDKSRNRSGVGVLKNFRPYSNNPASINYISHFMDTKTGNYFKYKKRFVFDQKDSLLSFHEDTYENGYFRRYLNGNKVRKNPNDNGFEIDSTYKSGDKEYRYNFLREKNRDVITKIQDSVYTETYIHGKIETKTVKFSGTLHEENFYSANDDIKRKKYIYYTADDNSHVLWEIKSTYKNGKIKSEYPAKRYYTFTGQNLIRNKRKFKNEMIKINGCGGGQYEKKIRYSDAVHSIYSPSILFSKGVGQRLSDNLESYGILEHELEIIYNKIISNASMQKEDHLGTDLSLHQGFYRYLAEYICRENYIIECKTSEGKTYTRKFVENPQDFSMILNIFESSE